MKLLVATIAIAVAFASPALAQSKKSKKPPSYGATLFDAPPPERYRNYAPPSRYSPNASWDVYGPSGRYIGSDPDPLVRLEMDKDAWGGAGGVR
jgi:hypothetical protein